METTRIIREIEAGNREHVDRLFHLLYAELRAKADLIFVRESGGHTLQPTALVHEAYLRMVDQREANWKDRAHFCAVAAMVMRRILVDHARRKGTVMRGAGLMRQELSPGTVALSLANPDDVLFAHQLIEELGRDNERQAKIVELRFFGELTVAETAEVLGMSKRVVEDEWTLIRAAIRSKYRAPTRD